MHDVGPLRAVSVGVIVVAAAVGTALVTLGPRQPEASDRAASSTLTTTLAPPSRTNSSAIIGTATTAPTTTTRAGATTTTAVDPGSLPQTDDRPSASGAAFDARVQGLWNAIVRDDPSLALPFFFPESAYLQVKAMNDPATDYQQRLIANYEQDIHTLHAQLGANAANASFTGIDVPDSQAVWVQPGEEYNKGSYWRVYGSTLNYTVDGTPGSFAVTSLISWRGEWYVVHLGEIR
jgi:hypothetical protein